MAIRPTEDPEIQKDNFNYVLNLHLMLVGFLALDMIQGRMHWLTAILYLSALLGNSFLLRPIDRQ
jgi:hypothetical protein